MRNILAILFLMGILIPTASASSAQTCDQVFDGGMLRYNMSYPFYDDWHNGDNKNVYINSVDPSYINNEYL